MAKNTPPNESIANHHEDSPTLRKSTSKNSPTPQIIQKNQVFKGDAETEVLMRTVPISADLDRWIRRRGRDLSLRQVDVQPAVKLVNDLIQNLETFLKDNEEQPLFRDVSVFNSGSYYELVKIHKPNEFDVMLKLKTPRIVYKALEDHNGLFYTISLCRPTRSEIRSFLLEDERTISSSKIIKEMHRLVKKFVKNYKVPEGHWEVCPKRQNSPAVTLVFKEKSNDEEEMLSVDIVPALEVPQGWPPAARTGLSVENWLGKNVRRKFVGKPVYFVPKRPKARNLTDVERESWRISFSHIEKEMIRFHGNKKTCCEGKKNECCRKLCLRLLKCLFEGLKARYPKELHSLCSYHGKTAFFHNLSNRYEDTMWTRSQLSECFMKLLVDFEHAVDSASLPHFFVLDYNLFSSKVFPKHSLQFLTSALKEQRELGLPLLQVASPAPALCHNPTDQQIDQQIFPESSVLTQNHDTASFATGSFAYLVFPLACVIICAALRFVLYA